MQSASKLTCIFVVAFLCIHVRAQQKSAEPGKNDPTAATTQECEPKRSVAPDGTIVIQNRDCSISRVSKEEIQRAPVEQPGTQSALPEKTDQAGKLREMKPQAPPANVDDPNMKAKYLAAMNGYFDYYTAGYRHRQRVFEWQLISSKVIFVLVVLLVFSGIYFAALQFHHGLRQHPAAAATKTSSDSTQAVPATPAEDSTVTKFSASAKGLEVSSPVLGVIILVISLAFFYLYLVYVYPITELF